MAKQKTPTDEKFEKVDFDLFEALAAIDRKDYGYYDRLTEEQQKKFSPYMMVRWMSNMKGSAALQQYHVLSVNEFANTHLFSEFVSKHPKLQWLLLTTVSPNMGKHRHEWMAYSGKTAKNKRAQKLLELYPHIKNDEAELLAQTISDEEYKNMLIERGYTDKEIKDAMK